MIPCKPSEPQQLPMIMIVALLKFWMPLPLLLNEPAITPTLTLLVEAQLHLSILIVALEKSCLPSLSLLNEYVMALGPILWLPETSNLKYKTISKWVLDADNTWTYRGNSKMLKMIFFYIIVLKFWSILIILWFKTRRLCTDK